METSTFKAFVFLIICLAFCCTTTRASDQIGAGTAADPAWYYGTPQYMGNGAFHTYIAIDHENEKAVAMGCEFSKNFFVDTPFDIMPTGMAMTHIDLDLPDITTTYTPFQSYETNWMPLGHPGIYDQAHIDFHFYMISAEKRSLWTDGSCGNDHVSAETFCKGAAPVPAPCCPPTYMNLGIVSAWMGSHLVSALDPALHGEKFEQTFIFGSMEGRIVFYEPMITRDFFERIGNGSLPKQCFPMMNPSHSSQAGMYPTQYCIYATDNNYRVELNEFAYIPGGCGTVQENGAATCMYNPAQDTSITMNWVKNCNSCPYYKYTKEMANDA